MRIAFAIGNLFPGGGLQRDCLEIAKLIRAAGHEVVIYTAMLEPNMASDDTPITVLANDAHRNHRRQQRFAHDVLAATAGAFDLLVGFDKLIGLDVLYCADPSMYFKVLKHPYLNLVPRHRVMSKIEQESFAAGQHTQIMLLSQNQHAEYLDAWDTEPRRMIVLPPTLSASRRKPEYRDEAMRRTLRSQLGLGDDDWVWLAIGVQPRIKGFDRAVRALAGFPQARLLIAGLSEGDRMATELNKLTQSLGLSARVTCLGHREDIPELMAAADLLVHPARYDTTGTVILEAIANGLPVVTTAVCGYAHHVDAASAGVVVQDPFEARRFVEAVTTALDPVRRAAWSKAAVAYGSQPWLCEGRDRAAEIIIAAARDKRGRTISQEGSGSPPNSAGND